MEKLRNPFDQSLSARYVTASKMKIQFALSYGIPIDTSSTKVKLITEGERKFDNSQHNGVIVSDSSHDLPYPLRIAKQKVCELRKDINPDPWFNIVSDVVWSIRSEDNLTFNLNKPQAEPQREKQLIKLFDYLRGKLVSSDAGIALISPDLKHIDYYYTSLTMGRIKPNLDLDTLQNIVRHYPNYSGGLTFELMIQYVIDLLEDFRFMIRNVNIIPINLIKTPRMSERESVQLITEKNIYFSSDITNFPLAKVIAIGIIPPDLSF